ncbi:MAG: mdtK [Gemmatimonadetes bacterium]|nr:mdtK [Gemmatimonadota bacterium]
MRATAADEGGSELRATLSLALPVVLVQVGWMLMGVVDTMMVGRISPTILAAVALGSLYFFNVTVLAMGTLMALDPLVSHALGAGDTTSVRRNVQRGMVLTLLLATGCALLMLPARALFVRFHQPVDVVPLAVSYVHISIAGVWPLLAFGVLRQTLQAHGRIAPIVWTMVLANLLNAGLNWVLVYGHLGSPPMGAAGSAMATVVARWFMLFALLFMARDELTSYLSPFHREAFDPVPLRRMLALGLPIGLQQVLEVTAFNTVGLLMGVFGTAPLSAHQIAIMMAALTFMVPLGVAAAASVRVGLAVGRNDRPAARAAARSSVIVGVGFMTCTALAFLLAPGPIARLFTSDAEVLKVAVLLIPVAGVFQVFDGLQSVSAGVLRGLGDTRAPLLGMLSAYWFIGIPTSVWLGFHTSLGPVGLWWGFVAGLASVAVFLTWRIRRLFLREFRRVSID